MVNSEDEKENNPPPEIADESSSNGQGAVQPEQIQQVQYQQPAARLTAPPQWKASMSYEEWRLQVEMWDKLCGVRKVDPAEQGYALFNLVSQHTDHNVVSNLNSAVKNKDINVLDGEGVQNIIKLLHRTYRKDDTSKMMKSWSDFINLRRKDSQDMSSFLNNFDQANTNLKISKITLPGTVLALHMLERSGLSVNDKKLVMTGVELVKTESVVEDMMNSIKKYFGEGIREVEKRPQCDRPIKEEPVFNGERLFSESSKSTRSSSDPDNMSEEEEAYYTNWRNRGKAKPWRRTDNKRSYSNHISKFNRDKRDNDKGEYKPKRYSDNDRRRDNSRSFKKEYSKTSKTADDSRATQKFNPRLRCNRCESVMHLIKDCPHSDRSENVNECREISEMETAECHQVALLDSACSKNVVGEEWIREYIDNLTEEDKTLLKVSDARSKYSFGGSDPIAAADAVRVPCIIAGKKTFLWADIVQRNIPFLISKEEMAKRGFKLDLGTSTIEVDGEVIPIITTESGLIGISLWDYNEVAIEEQCNLVNLDDTVSSITKLHKQLGHCSAENLKKITKNANIQGENVNKVIDQVLKECDSCARYKRTPSTPVVGLPMATKFNEVVALDLKQFTGINGYVIYMVDMFSRFCKARVISNKKPETVIKAFTMEWIAAGMGPPGKILVDNGGEFANNELNDLSEQLNFEICVTSAYSPWSNGLCERNHAVVDKSVLKMMYDGFPLKIALAWSINAKNTLYNVSGFSPVQIVTGQNPNFPGVSYNLLPANEGADESLSSDIQRNLNAMYLSRKAYLEAENSERVKRALKRPLRDINQDFMIGDVVFYKRPNIERWKGPAKIVGKEGKTLILRHGGLLIKAASCRIVKREYIVSDEHNQNNDDILETENSQHDEAVNLNDDQFDEAAENIEEMPIQFQVPVETEEIPTGQEIMRSSPILEIDSKVISNEQKQQLKIKYLETRLQKNDVSVGDTVKLVKEGKENEWETCTVTEKGKRPGRKDHWVKLMTTQDEEKLIDCTKTAMYKADASIDAEPGDDHEECYVVTIPTSRHSEDVVIKAKVIELTNWKQREVYDEIKDCDQNVITTTWVITEKPSTELGVKARLVVRGFQEQNQSIEVESPTVFKNTLKVVLAIAANQQWQLTTIDIKAAFLQGNKIERNVYVIPPKEAHVEKGYLWRLRKTVYGLNDAARAWFISVKGLLINLGCTQSVLDPALFIWRTSTGFEGILVLHVDDFLVAGTKSFFDRVVKELTSNFEAGKICKSKFNYIGLSVEQTEDGILVNQHEYIRDLADVINDKEHEIYHLSTDRKLRTICGQLNWVAAQSRPDLSFMTYDLNVTKSVDPVEAVKKANKAFRRMKELNGCYNTKFSKLGDISTLKIVIYSDASSMNLGDKVSTGKGHLIVLMNEEGKISPLSWGSHKCKRVVSSTLSAETLAFKDTLDHGVYVSHLISEIYFDQFDKSMVPVIGFTDNQSLDKALRSSKHVEEKRLNVDLATIRQMQQKDEIEVKWEEGAKQLADPFTKITSNSDKLLVMLNKGEIVSM